MHRGGSAVPTRTEHITNPDGTVTTRKTSGRDVKHEADWGDGPHPDEKPHTGSSALDRKWEKAEEARKQRLLGRDGGPKEGDIRSANDEALAKAAERRRRMRVLRGDPEGTSSQEGIRRADWLLTESKKKDELKAWVGGATGERPDLWGEKYRSEDRQRLNYERSAEASGEDWEKWSGDFKGFTGSDPTGTWADDRQTISAAEEAYEKDEERYRTDFRELTGQDSTGEPDRDQMLINFYERRNLRLAKSTDPVTAEQREAALAEIAKKLERYRTEFRAYTGQDSTGDPDQDQFIINFYERRSLGLRKSTDPISQAELEEVQAKRDQKRSEYARQFLVYTGQPSTGDPERDAEIINVEQRKTAGQLPALEYRDEERDRQAARSEYARQFLVYTGQPSTGDPERDAEIINVEQRKTAGQLPALEYRDEERDRQAARILQLEAYNSVFSDAVAAPPNPGLDRAKFSGLVDQTGRPVLSHLIEARAGNATPAFPDPSPPVTVEDEHTAAAADLKARIALSQSGLTSFQSTEDPMGFGPDGGWVLGVGGPRRNDVEGFDTGQPGGWIPGSPNVLQRTNDPLASVTGAGLDAFAEQYPVIIIDGNPQPTRELLELNRVTTETGPRQGGPRRDDHTGFQAGQLAAYLNKLALEGRASTTGGTPFIPLDAQRRTTPRVYNAAGNLRPLSQGDYRTRGVFTTEDGFTGTAHQIRRRADEQLTSRDRLVLAGEVSRILTLPAKDIGARMESSPGGRLYLSGEGVSGGDLAWAGVEAGAVYSPQLAVGAVRGGPQAWGQLRRVGGQLKRAFPGETPAQAAVRAAELQQYTLAWQSAQAAANPLRGRVVTMYSTPSEGIESAIIKLPDGSHRILEGPFKSPPPGAGTRPPAPTARQSILDQPHGPYSTYVDPGTVYRLPQVADPIVFPPPAIEFPPPLPGAWDPMGRPYYIPDTPSIYNPAPGIRQNPGPGWKKVRKVFDDADAEIWVKDEPAFPPPNPDEPLWLPGRRSASEPGATPIPIPIGPLPAETPSPSQSPASVPAPSIGPSGSPDQVPADTPSPAPSPSSAPVPEDAPAPTPQQVPVPETAPQLRQAPALDTSVLRGAQTVPQPVPVTSNLSAPAPNIQQVPALEPLDLTAPAPAPDPVPEPDPITASDPLQGPVPPPSWPGGEPPQQLRGNRPRRPPRPPFPDVIDPSFGEGGFSGLDGYPRVVAFTKTVEVQAALNDGDSVETPVQVKDFRVIATGRRPHPAKLLEGRHVDVKTDAGGAPSPVQKPPTRNRRRSLNKPPLGPQSRRQPRNSATRQSGVPMLRRIGPRIGRRR